MVKFLRNILGGESRPAKTRGGRYRECASCGALKEYSPSKPGAIDIATPGGLAGVILRCSDCGRFLCHDCVKPKDYFLHCPECGGNVALPTD